MSPKSIIVEGNTYHTDSWTNTSPSILSSVNRRLHLQTDHPISLTRRLIESRLPGFTTYNDLFPIVSVAKNFDSLGFPPDHPGRSRTDTYYLNRDTVLRTHTSAHQPETFGRDASAGFCISADVYRRDAIDRSHYPAFHQMEIALTWDRRDHPHGNQLAARIRAEVDNLPKHGANVIVEDPNPPHHPEHNPMQVDQHTPAEAEAVAAHLKATVEDVVVAIFFAARAAAGADAAEPLRMRWVQTHFPFTAPSYELEVLWQGAWLEVLGCGVVRQPLLEAAGVPHRIGWAFAFGLERIAMLVFGVPDIRLFWSSDERFLRQFRGVEERWAREGKVGGGLKRFVPFSKHPACYKDVSFWLPEGTRAAVSSEETTPDSTLSSSTTTTPAGGLIAPSQAPAPEPAAASTNFLHENDVMQLIRDSAPDSVVEDVSLIDNFTHPRTGRGSLCYRVNYRSWERTLTNEEVNELHERVREGLVERFGVELR